MERIKKWLEWIGAFCVAAGALIVGVLTLGTSKAKEETREAERSAEADHAVVRHEREKVADESTSDLYKDLTGEDK